MSTPVTGDIDQLGNLRLTSPAFEAGDRMPDSIGFGNENTNPPLQISAVPAEAESLVLIMDDSDAKPMAGIEWTHWLVFDIDPATTNIPEGWESGDQATVAYNDFLTKGFDGPAPPEGDEHVYRFKLLALDSDLDLPPYAYKERIGAAIEMGEANVLAQTQLSGRFGSE